MTTTYSYDLNTLTRLPTSVATSDGTTTRTTSYTYDDYGRAVQTTMPAGITTNTYTDTSSTTCLTTVVDPAQRGIGGRTDSETAGPEQG